MVRCILGHPVPLDYLAVLSTGNHPIPQMCSCDLGHAHTELESTGCSFYSNASCSGAGALQLPLNISMSLHVIHQSRACITGLAAHNGRANARQSRPTPVYLGSLLYFISICIQKWDVDNASCSSRLGLASVRLHARLHVDTG